MMNEYEAEGRPRWTTIARYFSSADALFFKSVLEGHGIPAFLRGEYVGQLLTHLTFSGVFGGIELQVPERWEADAITLLETGVEEQEEEELAPGEEEHGQERT